MSKFAVVESINGNFTVKTEHDTAQSAMISFHDRCRILWNSPDVIKGYVKIVDDQLVCYEGKSEVITHEEPEPEPEE